MNVKLSQYLNFISSLNFHIKRAWTLAIRSRNDGLIQIYIGRRYLLFRR